MLGKGTANTLFYIESSDGTEALTFQIPRTYSTMLFSSPKLVMTKTYQVYIGGSVASGTSFNGLYTSGTYTFGTQASTFTTSSVVTQAGGTIGP